MSLWERIKKTRLYQSIYRNDYPDSPRNQVLVIMNSLVLHLHPVRIPKKQTRFTYTFGLGGTSLLMFVILTITGVWLMWYYVPAIPDAYFSVRAMSTDITFGQFFRNLHRWAAHGMVLVVFLHMCRVFYTGSYKPPREFNWVLGVVLLFVTFFLSFTGYLLPWDQLAFWAISVGMQLARATPPDFVGKAVQRALLGGFEIAQPTLVRWYTLHVIFLPLLCMLLMGMHFWRVRKDGGISTPTAEDEAEFEAVAAD